MKTVRRYIYKITFLCGSLAGHYYIGKHKTTAKWDSYTGSGVVCRDYFKKYGAKKGVTYIKEILEDNIQDDETLDLKEKQWVGDLWETDPLCENLMPGGIKANIMIGEKNPNYGKPRSPETRKKISEANKGKPKSERHKEHCRIAALGNIPWNKGLTYHSEKQSIASKKKWGNPEYRKKCSESHKGKESSRAKPVISTVIETGVIEHWKSARQAGLFLGKSSGNITSCLKGRRTDAFGRTWEYAS